MSVRKANHAVLHPRVGAPGPFLLLLLAAGHGLSRVATAWHGRPAATSPTMQPWAGGQGEPQARWARCPLSFLERPQWSRRF